MLHRMSRAARAALLTVVAAMLPGVAMGQFAGKGPPRPAASPSSPRANPAVTTPKKSAMNPAPEADRSAPGQPAATAAVPAVRVHAANLLLGDLVEGMVDRRNPNRITFAAVAATEVTFELRREDARQVRAKLIAPDGAEVLEMPTFGRGALKISVGPVALPQSGIYTIAVDLDDAQCAPYHLATRADYPLNQVRAIALEQGRPVQLPLGGMAGWRLRHAQIQIEGDAPTAIAARLATPDGAAVDLAGHGVIGSDGSWIKLRDVPLDSPGEHLLTIADLRRSSASARVVLRFDVVTRSRATVPVGPRPGRD